MTENLFSGLPESLEEERFDTLLEGGGFSLQRIVSTGQASPTGFWYDQEEDEWVLVMRGRARLQLRDPQEQLELGPGDWLLIPAHRPHRVEWTDPEQPTVWLALHGAGLKAEDAGTGP